MADRQLALVGADIDHIAATVKQQDGFVAGYSGQDPHSETGAHAYVVFQNETAPRGFAEGVLSAIPSATMTLIEPLVHAQ